MTAQSLDPQRALFANEAFYLAFAQRDTEAMVALWARHHPVTCIHPGWNPLTDREEVLESWTAILANPDAPDVRCHHARASAAAGGVLVLCYEAIGDAMLVASNLFVAEDGEARLVHHQASPCANPPEPEAAEPLQ